MSQLWLSESAPKLVSLSLLAASVLLAMTACSTAPETASPFTSDEIFVLQIDEERSDRLRASDAINPRDGAPYRAYHLDLERDDVIRIAVESGDLTPSLSLYAPNGTLIGATAKTSAPTPGTTSSGYGHHSTEYGLGGLFGGGHYDSYGTPGAYPSEQYDGVEGRSNLIRKASDTGTHTLIVSSRFSDEYGSFNLRTEKIDTEPQFTFPGDAIGFLFEGGRLHPSTRAPRNRYPFEIEEITAIEFELESRDFEAHLSIVDARTEEIILTHVEHPGRDAKLLTELPAGRYEIWASSTRPGADGRYTLRAEIGSIDRSEEFFIGDNFRSFLGLSRESIPSSMRTGESVTFTLDEPAIFDVVMNSNDFDSYLVLADENGRIITEDHDSGRFGYDHHHYDPYSYLAGVNARINWPLEAGTYTLWATSSTEESSGVYTLESQLHVIPEGDEINIGESATGAITQASELHMYRYTFVEYFALEVEENQELKIEIDAEDFDAYLLVEDETGQIINESDHLHFGASHSEMSRLLTAGTYKIGVTTIGPNQFGRFTLGVSIGSPSSQHGTLEGLQRY